MCVLTCVLIILFMRFTLPHLTILFTHNVDEILTTVREEEFRVASKVCGFWTELCAAFGPSYWTGTVHKDPSSGYTAILYPMMMNNIMGSALYMSALI